MSESQEQPIPTEAEISSPPVAKAGATSAEKSLEKPRKGISKRQLAARLTASAAIAATIGLKGDTMARGLGEESVATPTGVVRELSIQDLEKRAEQMYQIQILSPQELPEFDYADKKVKTTEWTKEDISNLTKSLDKLPPNFYSPTHSIYRVDLPRLEPKPEGMSNGVYEWSNKNLYDFALNKIFRANLGQDFFISREDYDKAREQGYFARELKAIPVEFVLVPTLEPDKKWFEYKHWGVCFCASENENPRVVISSSRFRRSEQSLLSYVAHELTHRVTKSEDEKFVFDLLRAPRDVSMRKYLTPELLKTFPVLALRLSPNDTIGIMDRLTYGSKNTSEFLAVGSEFYIQGKERFLEAYGQFIGEEKANKLYDYTRDRIFRGTEYRDYQLERKP